MPTLEALESYNRWRRAADDTRRADRKAREKARKEFPWSLRASRISVLSPISEKPFIGYNLTSQAFVVTSA
jgi:hypothetical protein